MNHITQTRNGDASRASFRIRHTVFISLCSAIWCFAFTSCVLAQDSILPFALSPRVGEVIDRSEREYFGLFPSAPDFVSARFFRTGDGRVQLEISRQTSEGVSHSTMILNNEAAEELRNFVEDFERVLRKEITVRWDLIAGLVRVPSLESREGVEATVTTPAGERFKGTLLYAADSMLVLWQSADPYNWRNLESAAKGVRFSQIGHIAIKREGRFWSGAGYGALIGGGLGVILGLASGDDTEGLIRLSAGAKAVLLGIVLGVPATLVGGMAGAMQGVDTEFDVNGDAKLYKALLPGLNKEALFSPQPPPELQTFSRHMIEAIPEPSSEHIGRTSTPLPEPSAPKLHISLGGDWMTLRANTDIVDAFNRSGFGGSVGGWFGTTHYPVDHNFPVTWNLGAEYSLTDRIRLGVLWERIPEQEVSGKDNEVERAQATCLNFCADYVLVPVDRMLLSRFECAVGAGLSYNSLNVDGSVSSFDASAYGGNPSVYAVNKGLLGVNLRGSLDYYFSRNFSLQGRVQGRFIGAVEVPSVVLVNPNNGAGKILSRHFVDFSGMDFSLGLRFHL